MKKTTIIVIILILSNLPISCNNEVGCGGATSKIIEITSYIGSFKANKFIDIKSPSCEFAAIKVVLSDLEYTYYTENFIQRNNTFFISPLFACSPKNELLNPITSIRITSSEPLYSNSKEFASGTNLVELFNIANENNISIPTYVEEHNSRAYFFRDLEANFSLILNQYPDKPIHQKLQFDFELKDSNNIYFETAIFQCQ